MNSNSYLPSFIFARSNPLVFFKSSDEITKIITKNKDYNRRIRQLYKDTLHSVLISGIDNPSSNIKWLFNSYVYRLVECAKNRIKKAGFNNVSIYMWNNNTWQLYKEFAI